MNRIIVIDGRRYLSNATVKQLREKPDDNVHLWVKRCARRYRLRIGIARPKEYPHLIFFEEQSVLRAIEAERSANPAPKKSDQRKPRPAIVGLSKVSQAIGLPTDVCRALIKRPDLCPPVRHLQPMTRMYACTAGFSQPSVDVFGEKFREWTKRAPRRHATMLAALGAVPPAKSRQSPPRTSSTT